MFNLATCTLADVGNANATSTNQVCQNTVGFQTRLCKSNGKPQGECQYQSLGPCSL
jgi:hypothetical protein